MGLCLLRLVCSNCVVPAAAPVTRHTSEVVATDGEVGILDAPPKKPMPHDFIDLHLLIFTRFGVLAGEGAADEDISS